jgi:hypothetical protein
MTEIPHTPVTQDTLAQWFKAKRDLAALRVNEMLLRKLIFSHYFPSPKEGTNTVTLPDAYQLKGTHVINRKLVEESMQALTYRPQIGADPQGGAIFGPSKLEEAGINPSQLIKWKPEISITVYRELTEEQMHLVDQMLLIEEGSPSLDITPPSTRKPRK